LVGVAVAFSAPAVFAAPLAPTNLRADGSSPTTVALFWQDNATDDTSMEVERSTDGSTFTRITTLTGFSYGNSYWDSTGNPGTTYYYRVRALNSTGASGYSNIANATTYSVDAASPFWESTDIGAVAVAGQSSGANGVITIRGSGSDIWDRSDEFHYYWMAEWAGDIVMTARVTSLTNTHGWAKAGLMIRNFIAPENPNVFMALSGEHGSTFQYRTERGEITGMAAASEDGSGPRWLRLVRLGSTYTGYDSFDGVNWRQRGTVTNAFGFSEIGFAVTSHNDGTLCTATFDNISIQRPVSSPPPPAPTDLRAVVESATSIHVLWTPGAPAPIGLELERATGEGAFARIITFAPEQGGQPVSYTDSGLSPSTTYRYRIRHIRDGVPSAYSNIASATTHSPPSTGTWMSVDIGNVARAGTTTEVNSVVTIEGSGADIWNQADEFRYHHRTWSGDGVITARVAAVGNTDGWAKAAVMFRETLAANSRHAMMLVSAQHGTAFQYRSATGADMATTMPTETSGWRWVRIVRAGNVFTGYVSTDGVAWTQSGTITLSGMPSSIYVGLAVTSHNDGVLCTAQFDNLAVSGSTPVPQPPQVASFTIESQQSGADHRATYRLVFTESVTGVDVSDFTGVNVAGQPALGMTPEIVGVVGSGASYAITARMFYDSTSGGQFRIDLNASGTGITDTDGNALVGGATGPVTKSAGGPWPISQVSGPPSGTYTTGQLLSINVNYGVTGMVVSGTPRIALTIGAATRYATYANLFPGSFGQVLVFQYTVQAGDIDTDGITVNSPIELNGGTIQGGNGADGLRTFTPPNTTGVIVNGTGGTPPPAAPTNLAATVVSPTEVRLAWTDNATNEAGFEIFRATGNSSSDSVIGTVGANIVTYLDPTVSPGLPYQYRVRAVNVGGASVFSNLANVTTSSGSNPWQSLDIGTSTAGSTNVSGGTVTLAGSGSDIWNSSDGFRFYYQQETAQDFDIVARVSSLTNTNGWAKAGVMFRSALDPSSRFFMLVVSPEHGTVFQFRGDRGQLTSSSQPTEDGPPPRWLKVSRRGINYTGFISRDGVTWTPSAGGSSSANSSTEPMYVGLVVTSHNDGVLCNAVFDNITITPVTTTPTPAPPSNVAANVVSPTEIRVTWSDNANNETGFEVHRAIGTASLALHAIVGANLTGYSDTGLAPGTTYTYNVRAINGVGPSNFAFPNATATTPTSTPAWSFRDIGAVGIAGSNSSGTNTITISASGSDIWDRADAFRFVYRAWTGDGVVEARVASMDNTNDWAKAGVMIRESLDANSRNVFLGLTPSYHGALAQARSNTGDLTSETPGPAVNAPYWVRLVRSGSSFYRYFSTDGVNWTNHGFYIITMNTTVFFGFAVTSHDNSRLNTAVFSDPFIGTR
jgi:hypothetical protein